MFFEGNLQDGIQQALRDSKPVACFVLGTRDIQALKGSSINTSILGQTMASGANYGRTPF